MVLGLQWHNVAGTWAMMGISCLVQWLQGNTVPGTLATMEYCAWYIGYEGGLLPVLGLQWILCLVHWI